MFFILKKFHIGIKNLNFTVVTKQNAQRKNFKRIETKVKIMLFLQLTLLITFNNWSNDDQSYKFSLRGGFTKTSKNLGEISKGGGLKKNPDFNLGILKSIDSSWTPS